MKFNQVKFAKVVEAAKAKTTDKRWLAAIEKAVAGLASGWIVTELADGIMVTTESGTYHANADRCECKASAFGQPCKHRSLARLIELYNAEPERESKPEPTLAPRIVRSVERDVVSGCRVHVVRFDGWTI